MIEIIVGIIMILFYVYLVFTFFGYTSLVLNIILITALYFLIIKDLKNRSHHKYYLFALIPSALFFIFSLTGFISLIINGIHRLFISEATLAVFMVYLFANAIGFVYEYSKNLKYKK